MAISVIGGAAPAARSERTVFITSTQSWTAPADVTSVDVVLVSGGGGGAAGSSTATSGAHGGGGGGGGYIARSFAVSPSTAYTITIGAGGAGATSLNTNGAMGGTSSFGSFFSLIGGGGGSRLTTAAYGASSGGSGGGASTTGISGGGGGAGSVKTSTASDTVQSYNFLFSVLGSASNNETARYGHGNPGINGFAGGGAGGCGNDVTFVQYSVDGGGVGSRPNAGITATPGVANSGGGGGGGSAHPTTSYNSGGSGGSGICIIKYWSAL